MSKWIYFSIDERKAMIQGVVEAKNIDEAAAEKDWWVTAILYALFHTKASEYLLFKGGTSLSKGWDIIDRFSEDIDLALGRDFFLNEMNLSIFCNTYCHAKLHKKCEKRARMGKKNFTIRQKTKTHNSLIISELRVL